MSGNVFRGRDRANKGKILEERRHSNAATVYAPCSQPVIGAGMVQKGVHQTHEMYKPFFKRKMSRP